MTEKRQAYEEKLAAQLREWNAQITLLKAKTETAKAEAKVGYYATLEKLQHQRDAAHVKLEELKAAGDEAWEEVKIGAEKAWVEIKTAFNAAIAKLK